MALARHWHLVRSRFATAGDSVPQATSNGSGTVTVSLSLSLPVSTQASHESESDLGYDLELRQWTDTHFRSLAGSEFKPPLTGTGRPVASEPAQIAADEVPATAASASVYGNSGLKVPLSKTCHSMNAFNLNGFRSICQSA